MKIRYTVLLAAASPPSWPRLADERRCRPVNPAELIALLKSNAPKTEKVKAFKPLAVFGNKDAVPAIAPYLADEELSSWARIALEAIPDPACDEALRKAETGLKGRLLIGVINSIGVRRDAKAVDALVKRLGDADADVAAAAAAALGRIGGEAAAKALERSLATAPPAVRGEVADAVVRCAEKDLAAGKKDEAIRLYDLVSKADVPQNRVLEGVRGAIIARGPAGLPMLVELLKSTDKKRFALGLKLTREISGSGSDRRPAGRVGPGGAGAAGPVAPGPGRSCRSQGPRRPAAGRQERRRRSADRLDPRAEEGGRRLLRARAAGRCAGRQRRRLRSGRRTSWPISPPRKSTTCWPHGCNRLRANQPAGVDRSRRTAAHRGRHRRSC